MHLIHPLLLLLSAPLVLLYLLLRALRDRRWASAWDERFLGTAPSGPVDLWIHAASVGEVEVAVPVIRGVLDDRPETRVHLSCVTPTGRERAETLLAGTAGVGYLPYDVWPVVHRALSRAQPRAVALVETEFWPCFMRGAAARGARVHLVNARVSPRAAARYGRFPGALKGIFEAVDEALAQSEADRDRLIALGLPPDRCRVSGNIKLDRPAPAAADAADLHRQLAGREPVWVAGSVRPDELRPVLEAHAQVLEVLPDAVLVLAPRHPERFDEAAEAVRGSGLEMVRRSSGVALGPDDQVLLLDTLGELAAAYPGAGCAFVGGSLVPVGGHSLVEPASAGTPVLAGPHLDNTRDVADALIAAGGLIVVEDAGTLAGSVIDLLHDRDRRATVGAAAEATVSAGRGALERTVRALLGSLAS